MEERRNSVVIYEGWHQYLKRLTPEQYVKGMDLIMEYALDGVVPETDDIALLGFLAGITPIINSNNKRYKASKKGGRPKKAEVKTDENLSTD